MTNLFARRCFCVGLLLAACFLGACTYSPTVYKPWEQLAIDRKYVDVPAGFELKLVMANLTSPSAVAFEDDGTMIVAETGVDGDEPRIWAVKKDASLVAVYPFNRRIPFSPVQPGFQIYGPIGGMVVDHHRIYVSHRDKDGRGMISVLGFDGTHSTIQADLPAQGDYGVTDLATYKGRIYFGIGAATNSAVVGLDNIRWLRRHLDFCDKSYGDLELLGLRFSSKNPFAGIFGPGETAVTGPEQPFGVSTNAHIHKSRYPGSAVCSVSLAGGDFQVEAFGIRYPRGLAFNEFNALYVTNQGMEMRGLRPVKDDPDVLLKVFIGSPPVWYGWPDYSADMQPITDQRFQPPVWMVLPSGFPKVGFLIDHEASDLRPPNPSSLLKAKMQPLSGTAKLVFAPESGPLSRWRGDAFIAQSGDRAPFSNSGAELTGSLGYKVVRANLETGKVEEFVHNTQFLPASKLGGGPGLERPIDVKIGPDGALYIVDFGRLEVKSGGREKITRGSGKIFRLSLAPTPNSK